MIERLYLALSKLVFCIKASVDVSTFFRLLGNTKRLSFSSSQRYNIVEKPAVYQLNLNGIQLLVHLRTHSGDISILYEVFWKRAYQKFPIDFPRIRTIIDVGANIGLASLFFYSISPKASILAIEPEQHNFNVLQKNICNSASTEQITAINAAISNCDEMLYLNTERFAYNTSVNYQPQGIPVRSISLNTCFEEYNLTKVDLIKIDVEGFEHHIFSSNLEWLDKVENILIEIHSEKDYTACIETLIKRGFVIHCAESKSPDQENIYWACKS